MLYPIMTKSRLLIDLSGLWEFRLEKQTTAIPMPVPASGNDFRLSPEVRNYHGQVIYQRTICLPDTVRKQRVVLRFEALVPKAEICLNEVVIKEHEGGFLPFEVEITNWLHPGENLLRVGFEHRISSDAVCNELIRQVKLYTTPKDYIIDIELNAATDKKDAMVSYKVRTHGHGSVKVEIFDKEGTSVAHAVGTKGKLEIADVNLWQPLAAYLYQVKVTFAKDVYVLPFGVRTVQAEAGRFLMNEKHFYFKGYTRSEEISPAGSGLNYMAKIKDLALLKWQKANSIRTFFRPYSEEMMRLCDMEGIAVIVEIPAEEISLHPDLIRDIISRDKNYACVVMWSLANMADFNLVSKLLAQIRNEDSQKRPCMASDVCINDIPDGVQQADVICLDSYDANRNSEDIKTVKEKIRRKLEFWETQGKPVILMGYGTEAILGVRDISSDTYTEEYQIVYLKSVHRILDKFQCAIGEIISDFADDTADCGKLCKQGIHNGIFTKERKPKMSAYYLRSRWKKISDLEWKK